jgi:hypothetical protein
VKNSLLIVVVMVLVGCNPVRFVLRDAPSFRIVADEVIKRGYCLNDTTIIRKTDTLELHDTTTVVYVDTTKVNDTTYLWETKFHTVIKVRTIRDSVKVVVVDSAMVGVFRKELAIEKEKNKENMHWRKMFSLILVASFLFFILLFKIK